MVLGSQGISASAKALRRGFAPSLWLSSEDCVPVDFCEFCEEYVPLPVFDYQGENNGKPASSRPLKMPIGELMQQFPQGRFWQ